MALTPTAVAAGLRTLALLAAALLLGVCTASAATKAKPPPRPPHVWSRPFALAGPYSDDLLPAQIAFDSAGDAAVGFGVFSEDFPWVSRGVVVTRRADGKLGGPRRVPGAKEILSLSYEGSALELLTGGGPGNLICCSAAGAVTLTGGRFRHQHTLVSGLDGDALGGLVGLPKTRMLAAVGTGAGVWVAQSPAVGRFRSAARLSSSTAAPQALAVAALHHGHSAVAWTEPAGAVPNVPATGIFLATGTVQGAPSSGRLVATAPVGYGIAELALAAGASGPTAAWTQSWYDRAGDYHSEAAVADLVGGHGPARTFFVPGQLASGLTMAADGKGDQVVAWKTCDELGSCSLRAASRRAGHGFAPPQRLGRIDVSEDPAAAVAPNGEALVGWVSGGHVVLADRKTVAARFGSPTTLSRSTLGSDVAVAFGPSGQAMAAWTQGTVAPGLIGAFRP